MKKNIEQTSIETREVGPIYIRKMNFLEMIEKDVSVNVPLATYETTLFFSIDRGAKVSRACKTFETTLLSDCMTRSVVLEASDAYTALTRAKEISSRREHIQVGIIEKSSKYAKLEKIEYRIISNLIYFRFVYNTANASGHNMTTIASDKVTEYILSNFPDLKYVSISSNYCVDKKVSSVNSILGRGKSVVAECTINRELCNSFLKTSPEKIVELNIKKNLIGSIISGSVCSANAHFANMLLAFYLATGQDAANIVEGSQGITFAEVRNDDLYFGVNLPNIIVGTVGNGKSNTSAKNNLDRMNLSGDFSSQKLAQIAASIVLCGELSLMAALTNQNELSRSHTRIERSK